MYHHGIHRFLFIKRKTVVWVYASTTANGMRSWSETVLLYRTNESLDQFQGANYFSEIDLRSGYHQLRMKKQDIPRLLLPASWSLWVLSHAFQSYQCSNHIHGFDTSSLPRISRQVCLLFIYDILTFSKPEEENEDYLRAALQILRQEKLYATMSKRRILKTLSSVIFQIYSYSST